MEQGQQLLVVVLLPMILEKCFNFGRQYQKKWNELCDLDLEDCPAFPPTGNRLNARQRHR